MNNVTQALQKIKSIHILPITSFFFGGGLCYAIEEKKYYHLPFVFFCPIAYGGYNIFKNRHIFISEKRYSNNE